MATTHTVTDREQLQVSIPPKAHGVIGRKRRISREASKPRDWML